MMLRLTLLLSLVSTSALAKERLAVMPVSTQSLPGSTVKIFDSLLVSAVGERGEHSVISAADINAMLGLEKMKEALGCNDMACAAEIGGALGVRQLLLTTADVLGDSLVLTTSLIDLEKNEAVARRKSTVKNDANLYVDAMTEIVARTFDDEGARAAQSLTANADEAGGATSGPEHRLAVQVMPRFGTLTITSCTNPDWNAAYCDNLRNDAGAWSDLSIAAEYGRHWFGRFNWRARLGAVDLPYHGTAPLLGVGVTTEYPLYHAGRRLIFAPENTVAIVGGLDAEAYLSSPVHARALASVGLRVFWISVAAALGVMDGREFGDGRSDADGRLRYEPFVWGFNVGANVAL